MWGIGELGRKSLWKDTNRGRFALVAANCLNKLNCRQSDGQYFMVEEAARGGDKQPLAWRYESRTVVGTLPQGSDTAPSTVLSVR